MVRTLIRTHLKPSLKAKLLNQPRCAEDSYWKGALKGTHGAPNGCRILIGARLCFRAGLLDGDGKALNLPNDYGSPDFTIAGSTLQSDVSFEIYFETSRFAPQPFVVTGGLSPDENLIAGTWRVACFDPVDCGCSGGGGNFKLKRERQI